ncbi:MAG: hypothetical protein PHH54_00455 [Candidatus Nanoarchaeia archaeon]|nr:hypothetical protein [Candidatus Nanoarchaeia archaeon]MDD5740434.1 hypothetical protein [Candidatus Nanoarchaeia archaeon]
MLTLNKEVGYEGIGSKSFERPYELQNLEEWSQNLEKTARQAFQDFLKSREIHSTEKIKNYSDLTIFN